MAVSVAPLDESNLPALRRFSEAVWERPRSEAYYHWRYRSAPFYKAWLALSEGECLATESALQRPWRMGSETVDVMEVFDWYARPELKNAGVGVRVMQALMKQPVPLMLVGGTEQTQSLLPRLKWERVGTSTRFVLALGAARTQEALERRLKLPSTVAALAARAAVLRPGVRPRPRAVPRGGRVVATGCIGDEIQALYDGDLGYGTVPRWTREFLDWLLVGFPGVGHFVPLYFQVDERLVGWSLLRIYATPLGCDAEIIELFTPQPDPEIFTWMISETASRAIAFRPGIIGARTTCPAAGEGFRRNAFRETSRDAVNFWLNGHSTPPEPLLIGSNTNDAALVPLPLRWYEGDRAIVQ